MRPNMSIGEATAGDPRAAAAADRTLPDRVAHYLSGQLTEVGERQVRPIHNPATGKVVREVAMATPDDVETAVRIAREAQVAWGNTPVAARAATMYSLRDVLRSNAEVLARAIVEENGKTFEDALGEVTRGLESVEYACALPRNLEGSFSQNVARGIDVHSTLEPIGVALCITPFNFPVMVPLWMIANALSCGNSVIIKPSEKDPGATLVLAELLTEAGIPEGVVTVLNGDGATADALLRHPGVDAVSFVGSTPIAQRVYEVGTSTGKRVQALGGAKNHMVVTAAADIEAASTAAVGAAFGAAGERCMAISVVLAVGDETADALVDAVRSKMAGLRVGNGMEDNDFGPLITEEHRDRVASYLDAAAADGARVVVDGRDHDLFAGPGYFIGPSLVDGVSTSMSVYEDEVFGPLLAIMRVDSLDEAIQLVRDNPFGNGAAIFTTNGTEARRFQTETNIGMIGVNVPIPVPVGWFSFGGWKASLFGDSHMYGQDGVRFFTRQRVVTTRW